MKKGIVSRMFAGAVAVMLSVATIGAPEVARAEKTVATDTKYADISRVTVHDPSIVKDRETGLYYVFGSHMATASSEDLVNWTQIALDYQFPKEGKDDPVYGNVVENFAESFAWAGYKDGDCKDNQDTKELAVWAPDVFWSDEYEWEDGTTGAYLMYYSASSTYYRSCIGVAVSKTLPGPFKHLDTLVYSGITENGVPTGNSDRNTKWDNDYLNIKELIEKGSANGGIDEVNPKWFDENGNYNNLAYPNCIDPVITRATDGKVYMTYGSFSGGLFMLEVDPKTGLVEYPGVDGTDEASGNWVDRYYGIHIAGANHASGEAPYITYDEATGYYYLYESYGGLTRTGGYNIRLFRSKNITGPYVDAAGNEAQYNGTDTDKYGIKLIGNYGFYDQRGYCSAGHNSALIDSDGAHYLVSHQRFDEGTEGHEVRVRQQFLNEDGWPVTAVYENRNEIIGNVAAEAVVGTYEFFNHGISATDGNMLESKIVTLNADGTVSGDESGTWTKADSGKGYDYVTVKIGDATYKGVFFEQTSDKDAKVMTFTAIGNNNESIWGSKLAADDELLAKVVAAKISLPASTRTKLSLPGSISGATVTWKSSDPKVISNKGVAATVDKDTKVTLTATVAYGSKTTERTFEVTVYSKPTLIYGYDFSDVSGKNIKPDKGSAKKKNATLIGAAKVGDDAQRGKVLEIANEAGARGVNYLKLPADTFNTVTKKGYTVSMWVNVSEDTFEHSALFEADAKAAYPMTRVGRNLIGRINANGYCDAIAPEGVPSNEWHMVTYTVTANGIRVYLDNRRLIKEEKDIASCFDTTNPACIQNAVDVMVGAGFIWSDEDVRNGKFSDIEIYNGAMTTKEVKALYRASK